MPLMTTLRKYFPVGNGMNKAPTAGFALVTITVVGVFVLLAALLQDNR